MNRPNAHQSDFRPGNSWIAFILLTAIVLWVAHVACFFPHEYSHSFSAWLLGWKSNPLALNYGYLNTGNLLAQFDIDENVDYAPIFASGHGYQAGFIALAGLFIGNFLLTYPLSRWGYNTSKKSSSLTEGFLCYWLIVGSIGNLIDYVPVRTFAIKGDIHTLVMGFNCSPWLVAISLGIPFAIILVHFIFWFAPRALHWLFPLSAGKRAVMVFLTAFVLFGFYGAAGWSEPDQTSHMMSVISVFVLIPIATILGFWLTDRFWIKTK
jgi:hypothetical protein